MLYMEPFQVSEKWLLFCHKFSRQKVTQSLVKADLTPGGAVVGCEYILKLCLLLLPFLQFLPSSPPSQDTLEEVHQQAETFQGRQKRSSLSSYTFTAGKQPIPGWMPFPFPQG